MSLLLLLAGSPPAVGDLDALTLTEATDLAATLSGSDTATLTEGAATVLVVLAATDALALTEGAPVLLTILSVADVLTLTEVAGRPVPPGAGTYDERARPRAGTAVGQAPVPRAGVVLAGPRAGDGR
jgi:hypothetical protein